MANSNFEKLVTSDSTLNRIQDNVQRISEVTSVIGRGTVISDLSFTGNEVKEVPHTLGRRFVGAIRIKLDANTDFLVEESATDSNLFVRITNTTATAAIASFWVF